MSLGLAGVGQERGTLRLRAEISAPWTVPEPASSPRLPEPGWLLPAGAPLALQEQELGLGLSPPPVPLPLPHPPPQTERPPPGWAVKTQRGLVSGGARRHQLPHVRSLRASATSSPLPRPLQPPAQPEEASISDRPDPAPASSQLPPWPLPAMPIRCGRGPCGLSAWFLWIQSGCQGLRSKLVGRREGQMTAQLWEPQLCLCT